MAVHSVQRLVRDFLGGRPDWSFSPATAWHGRCNNRAEATTAKNLAPTMLLRPATILACALAALFLLATRPAPAQQQDYSARLKDIADFEGVRDNVLVGYGLVVGLNRTGDTISNSVFTRQSLLGMLDRLGVNAKDAALKTQNTAAVIVTATLPPFARPGSRV
ncbi:MAG: flagellar basal body P-ring protein FlgI, partial [Alphaproteobacteria bacterium]